MTKNDTDAADARAAIARHQDALARLEAVRDVEKRPSDARAAQLADQIAYEKASIADLRRSIGE